MCVHIARRMPSTFLATVMIVMLALCTLSALQLHYVASHCIALHCIARAFRVRPNRLLISPPHYFHCMQKQSPSAVRSPACSASVAGSLHDSLARPSVLYACCVPFASFCVCLGCLFVFALCVCVCVCFRAARLRRRSNRSPMNRKTFVGACTMR